jgi:hypothetical protein
MVVPFVYYNNHFWLRRDPVEAVAEIFFKWTSSVLLLKFLFIGDSAVLDFANLHSLFPLFFQLTCVCMMLAPEVYQDVKAEKNKILPL